MSGPYKLDWVAQNIARNIEKSGFKNVEISCEQFAKIAGISGNTARSYVEDDFIQIDKYLQAPISIGARFVRYNTGGFKIRVSGCRYGPFGRIAYPVLPRIRQRIAEFVDHCIDFSQENSSVREEWRQARKKRLGFHF